MFSDHGRTELINASTQKLDQVDQNETAVAIYKCRPYIFPVGKHKDALFLIDTHPVSEEVGGNGNGLLVVTPDCSPRSRKLLVQWILKRLLNSGASEKELQSMAWLTPVTGVKIAFFQKVFHCCVVFQTIFFKIMSELCMYLTADSLSLTLWLDDQRGRNGGECRHCEPRVARALDALLAARGFPVRLCSFAFFANFRTKDI